MRQSTSFLLLPLLISALACSKPKSEDKPESADKKEQGEPAKKKDEPAKDDDAPKKAKKADKDDAEKVAPAGVGEIPPWAPDQGKAKACSASASAKTRFKTLQKGDDDDITENKADLAALEKDLAGDCRSAKRELADALNSGGFIHYKKKAYKEANRWWRAALVVRPSHVLARYNVACGLALDGDGKSAIAEMNELARATREGEAAAANFLEKAKSDDDLKSIRDEAGFKKALEASVGGLVGPRKEPELAAEVVKLLPDDWKKRKNPATEQMVTVKPSVIDFWTWRPDDKTELLVGTVVDDITQLGKPKGDINNDYGGIVVVDRNGGKPKLLLSRMTGESPPTVAAGKNHTVVYAFYQMCGDLGGTLSYSGGKVSFKEKRCEDLGDEPAPEAPKKALPKCAKGQSLVAADDSSTPYCAKSCVNDADCKPKKCGEAFMVDDKTGEVFTGVGKSAPFCEP